MTFPFGIVKDFRADVYDKNDDILRYAMLEMYVNGGNKKSSRRAARKQRTTLRHGAGILHQGPTIDGWIKERGGIGTHVNWVHTIALPISRCKGHRHSRDRAGLIEIDNGGVRCSISLRIVQEAHRFVIPKQMPLGGSQLSGGEQQMLASSCPAA
jgi:hypothetical protein